MEKDNKTTQQPKEGLHTQDDFIEKAWRDGFDSGLGCCGISTNTKENTLFEKWKDKNQKAVNERQALLDSNNELLEILEFAANIIERMSSEYADVAKKHANYTQGEYRKISSAINNAKKLKQ